MEFNGTEHKCFYCKKNLTSRYWIGLFKDTAQCRRLWCRIKSGHIWWEMGYAIKYKTLIKNTILVFSIPYLAKR